MPARYRLAQVEAVNTDELERAFRAGYEIGFDAGMIAAITPQVVGVANYLDSHAMPADIDAPALRAMGVVVTDAVVIAAQEYRRTRDQVTGST